MKITFGMKHPVCLIHDYNYDENHVIGVYQSRQDRYELADGDFYTYDELIKEFGEKIVFYNWDTLKGVLMVAATPIYS